jgi:hypothetical protein
MAEVIGEVKDDGGFLKGQEILVISAILQDDVH